MGMVYPKKSMRNISHNKSASGRILNMTTGQPWKLLIRFAVPMLIGNLFQQAYNLADSIIVGRLVGASALAAIGATNSVTFLFFSICNGMGSGGGIVVSQFFGAGDERRVKKAITNSAYLMLVSSLIMGLAAFFASASVLRLIHTPADILPDAVTYMRIACIGVPLIAVYNYASSMLRALGDSRTPLYFLVTACVINIVLDLLFVGPLNMGVFGAALATMLSQMIAGAGCLLFAVRTNPYFRLEREHFSFDRNITFRAMQIGFPLSLQWAMIAISTTGLQTVVNSFGSAAVAAFTATSRIENLVHMPFGSIGQALSTFAGQNYGARKPERIRTGFYQSMVLAAAMSVCLFLLMQLLGMQAVSAFVKDPEVIALGGRGLKLTSWFYLSLGTIYITRGIQNGMGDALFAFINGIIEVISRIGLPILLMQFFDIGVWVIWWTAGLTWMASAVFCLLRYVTYKRTL